LPEPDPARMFSFPASPRRQSSSSAQTSRMPAVRSQNNREIQSADFR
jgi:hypothetical protein